MRLRPLSARCATLRDSRLNNSGVGVVIHAPKDTQIVESAILLAASEIKFVIEDLGLENYSFFTNQVDKNSYVDIMYLQSKIPLVQSRFSRLK
jgi:hypothetical protein